MTLKRSEEDLSPHDTPDSKPDDSPPIVRLYYERRKKERRSGKDRRSGEERRGERPSGVGEAAAGFPERRKGEDRRDREDRRKRDRRVKRLRIPIFLKLACMFMLLILLTISILSFFILGRQKAQFLDQMIDLGMSTVRITANNAADKLLGEEEVALFQLVNDIAQNEAFLFAVITDHQNRIRAHSRIDEVGKIYTAPDSIGVVKEDNGVRSSIIAHGGKEVLYLDMPIEYQTLTIGRVRLAISQEGIEKNIQKATLFIFMLTIGIIVVGIFLSLGLSMYFSHPIKKLGASTRAMGAGEFDYRIKINRNDEFGDLAYAFNRMAEDLELNEKIKGSFGRYVTPEIAEMIVANPDHQWMKGAKVDASVLFVDIRGFTSMAEDEPPERIVELLNDYFTRITEIVIKFGGHLNKFMGDEAMAVFGAPAPNPRHGEAAVQAALEVRDEIDRFNDEKGTSDLTIQVGIGVNSGEMVAGNLGSQKRMEYTMVGDNVNVASRLTSIAKPGEILISKSTYDSIRSGKKPMIEAKGKVPIRGRRMEIEVFSLLGLEEGSRDG